MMKSNQQTAIIWMIFQLVEHVNLSRREIDDSQHIWMRVRRYAITTLLNQAKKKLELFYNLR